MFELDVTITGSTDSFFDYKPGEFCIIQMHGCKGCLGGAQRWEIYPSSASRPANQVLINAMKSISIKHQLKP